jgi:fermentation-respiration switch protein FrsA (DUF1100 family)
MARSAKRTAAVVVAASVVLVVGVMAVLAAIENLLIYHPEVTPRRSTTSLVGGVDVTDVYFGTEDGLTLHGWRAGDFSGGPVVLFCHGNAGNITHRAAYVSALVGEGLPIFIFDYRGYGQSEGRPDEQGLYVDARAAWDHLVAGGVEEERIVVLGRSLGGAVAIDLATTRPVARLIVESSFTTGRDMARSLFRGLPLYLAMRSRFDSASKVAGLRMPKLFLHGDRDDVVPYELGVRLSEAAAEPKTFVRLEGADHNSAPFMEELDYFGIVTRFARGRDRW